jgi:hypothetical protein
MGCAPPTATSSGSVARSGRNPSLVTACSRFLTDDSVRALEVPEGASGGRERPHDLVSRRQGDAEGPAGRRERLEVELPGSHLDLSGFPHVPAEVCVAVPQVSPGSARTCALMGWVPADGAPSEALRQRNRSSASMRSSSPDCRRCSMGSRRGLPVERPGRPGAAEKRCRADLSPGAGAPSPRCRRRLHCREFRSLRPSRRRSLQCRRE